MRAQVTFTASLLAGILLLGSVSCAWTAELLCNRRLTPSYLTWTIADENAGAETTVSQFIAPLTIDVCLGTHGDLVLSSAGAVASLDSNSGVSQSLSGAADLCAQFFYNLAQDHLLVQCGISLPSGKNELSQEEFDVALMLGHPLLGFRLKEYGRGLDFTAGAAGALTLSRSMHLGLGGGFIHHGSYVPLVGSPEYQPGTEASLSAGLDLGSRRHSADALQIDVTYRTYQTDQLGSADIFAEGNQLELMAAAHARSGRIAFVALGRVIRKENNTRFLDEGAEWRELEACAGTHVHLTGNLGMPLSQRVRMAIGGQWTHYSGADDPGVNGNTYGIGPRISIAGGGALRAHLQGHVLSGAIDGDDVAWDLNGFAISLGFNWAARTDR